MTKAIVFDIGGVLVSLDQKRCIEAFKSVLGFDRITELLDPYVQKGIYGELEEGTLPPEEFRARVLAESRPGSKPEDVDRCMFALLDGVRESTVSAVKSVAGKYPLYILSNNNPISMAFCQQAMDQAGIGGLFTDKFISCEMKMLKPSADFYREVVRRVGVAPEEILFIDDSLTNVKAARAVGIDARWLEPGMPLSQLLP